MRQRPLIYLHTKDLPLKVFEKHVEGFWMNRDTEDVATTMVSFSFFLYLFVSFLVYHRYQHLMKERRVRLPKVTPKLKRRQLSCRSRCTSLQFCGKTGSTETKKSRMRDKDLQSQTPSVNKDTTRGWITCLVFFFRSQNMRRARSRRGCLVRREDQKAREAVCG